MKNQKFYFFAACVCMLATFILELINRDRLVKQSVRQINIERRIDSARHRHIRDSIVTAHASERAKLVVDSINFNRMPHFFEHSKLKINE